MGPIQKTKVLNKVYNKSASGSTVRYKRSVCGLIVQDIRSESGTKVLEKELNGVENC